MKKLSQKQKIIVLVATVILIIAVATSITLPLVLLNRDGGIPKPYVEEFDQKNDIYVSVAWDKVNNATSYRLQYVFGNVINEADNIVTVKTEGLFYRIERQKGVLCYRVKRVSDDRDSEYSQWQYFNVSALKLDMTTNVTLNSAGVLSWPKVKYLNKGTPSDVPSYIIDMEFEGEYFDTVKYTGIKSYSNTLENYVNGYINSLMSGYDEDTDVWQDISLTVRVKSLNYYFLSDDKITKGYEFLYNAYDESEYYEQVITIDKNLYNSIKG